ncbi:FYVE zinc finger-domain-containing protein [Immersiella caudata]|uniref:RING-type E3 ubiquitin transferase n=1 Tax=Immersiella caudata TaxID=314043 RepID=A0AA39XE57_9PEZI|nr:FYVE zinc finger-domain-containing protein [Immersiella caudata]
MSAPRDGGGAAAAVAAASNQDHDTDPDNSISESSYAGSDNGEGACRHRTTRYHDMECERYFDCPTHLVERVLSDGEQGADEHGRVEEEDAIMNNPLEEDREEEEETRDGELQGGALLAEAGDARPATPAPRSALGDTAENPIAIGDNSPAVQRVNRPLESAQRATMSSADAQQASEYMRLLQAHESSARNMLRQSMTAQPQSFLAAQTQLSLGDRSLATRRAGPLDFTVPRWQPDAEVTYCPICHTQFSIWVRKHHCRKCGRVVCASCSPHRITIPHQYIVRPPWDPSLQTPRYPMGEMTSPDFGGERVRLCNPCVPDPNIAPPQTPGGHSRSQSGLSQSPQSAGAQPNARWSSYFGYSNPVSDPHIRSRSVTMQAGIPATLGRQGGSSQRPVEDRILSGTPPVYYQPSGGQTTNLPPGYGSVQRLRATAAAASSSSSAFDRLLPLPPIPPAPPARDPQRRPSASTSRPLQQQRHEIAEEDECPVCHRELPSRALPNFEALRESHITSCITSHSSYSGAAGPSTGGEAPLPRVPPRRTGMFPYIATEKDCVDSAECTICLEEFEVGVGMARLECLCRFHRDCIRAWFERHPGRCPMHQHEDFGY